MLLSCTRICYGKGGLVSSACIPWYPWPCASPAHRGTLCVPGHKSRCPTTHIPDHPSFPWRHPRGCRIRHSCRGRDSPDFRLGSRARVLTKAVIGWDQRVPTVCLVSLTKKRARPLTKAAIGPSLGPRALTKRRARGPELPVGNSAALLLGNSASLLLGDGLVDRDARGRSCLVGTLPCSIRVRLPPLASRYSHATSRCHHGFYKDWLRPSPAPGSKQHHSPAPALSTALSNSTSASHRLPSPSFLPDRTFHRTTPHRA